MGLDRIGSRVLPRVVTACVLFISAVAGPTAQPSGPPISQLWEQPEDIASRDLYYGPWGAEHAPDPHAVYTFVRPKKGGANPGVVVRDASGRQWHVKQAPHNPIGDEGPAEVVLSRILSALGYHQPPVYYLPSFTMARGSETRTEPGGRFRLHQSWLVDRGSWSWQENPFLNTRPYQGLLVVLV